MSTVSATEKNGTDLPLPSAYRFPGKRRSKSYLYGSYSSFFSEEDMDGQDRSRWKEQEPLPTSLYRFFSTSTQRFQTIYFQLGQTILTIYNRESKILQDHHGARAIRLPTSDSKNYRKRPCSIRSFPGVQQLFRLGFIRVESLYWGLTFFQE